MRQKTYKPQLIMAFGKLILEETFSHWYTILFCKIRSNIVQPNCAIKWPWESHIIFLPILLAVLSCSLQIKNYLLNDFFSTISETWFHFSTNSISLQFLKIVFTFSTISETCFHLSTISETYFHLSTISISLRFWCDPK